MHFAARSKFTDGRQEIQLNRSPCSVNRADGTIYNLHVENIAVPMTDRARVATKILVAENFKPAKPPFNQDRGILFHPPAPPPFSFEYKIEEAGPTGVHIGKISDHSSSIRIAKSEPFLDILQTIWRRELSTGMQNDDDDKRPDLGDARSTSLASSFHHAIGNLARGTFRLKVPPSFLFLRRAPVGHNA